MNRSRRLATVLVLVALVPSRPVGGCGPWGPTETESDRLHHGDLPSILVHSRSGLPSDGSWQRERDVHLARARSWTEASPGWSGEIERIDAALVAGDLEAARSRLATLRELTSQARHSARPEHLPLPFAERAISRRTTLIEILGDAALPRAHLERLLRLRRFYETPEAVVAEEASSTHGTSWKYQTSPTSLERASELLQEMVAEIDPDSPLAPLLAWDDAAFSWSRGEATTALESFRAIAEDDTAPAPLRERARFMTARAREATGDVGGAAALYSELREGPLGATALGRRARLAHRQGSDDAWRLYRELWERFPDDAILAHVDRSARALASDGAAPAVPGLWAAASQDSTTPLEASDDPFTTWLAERWSLRTLYREGRLEEVLQRSRAFLAGARGRADRAFVGNLWANLLWADRVYDRDMDWDGTRFPDFTGAAAPTLAEMNGLAEEMPATDWAVLALFAARKPQPWGDWTTSDTPVDAGALTVRPLIEGFRLGLRPWVLEHIARGMPESPWPEDLRAEALSASGRLPTFLDRAPEHPLAISGLLRLVDAMERALFPLHGSERGKTAAVDGGGTFRTDEAIRALARWGAARQGGGDPWGTFALVVGREYSSLGAGTWPEAAPPPLAVPAEHPAFSRTLISRARSALRSDPTERELHRLLEEAASVADGAALRRIPSRDLPEALSTHSEVVDMVSEIEARLAARLGDVRRTLQTWSRLGYRNDVSRLLQESVEDGDARTLLRDPELDPAVRRQAGWGLLRRQVAVLSLDQAESTWTLLEDLAGGPSVDDEPPGLRVHVVGGRPESVGTESACGQRFPPDFVHAGEARCLRDMGPILQDLRELLAAVARAEGEERAEALYAFGRYSYLQAPALVPGLGELEWEGVSDGWGWVHPADSPTVSLVRAERIFRQIVDEHGGSDAAARAGYTLALMSARGRTRLGDETAPSWFERVCREHPGHALADDAGYWSRRFTGTGPLRDERVEDFPCRAPLGDMTLLHPPGSEGSWFRHQRALRLPDEVADENLWWFGHSILEHNHWGDDGLGRVVWRTDELLVEPAAWRAADHVHLRRRYSADEGRQIVGNWARVDLGGRPSLELAPGTRVGLRVPAAEIGVDDLGRGDVWEVAAGRDVGHCDDEEPIETEGRHLLVLGADARPVDLGAIR